MKITNEGWAVIEGDNYLSQEIIDKKRLDVAKEFLEQFREYIPVGGTVIDIGASLGDYTATFSEMVGPEGKVFAFEPNPPTFECAKHNLQNYSNVQLFQVGLGAEYGAADVIPDDNNVGASRLVHNSGGPVTVFPLDACILDPSKLCPRVDFIKIDAEGWEPLILDGAGGYIRSYRPVILIEVNTWPLGKMGFTAEDVFSRLDKLNYKFDRFDGPYGDVLCVPKERA